METHPLEGVEELEDDSAREVAADVAVLYSWANLEGGRYQDFLANRREHRFQIRQRAAERRGVPGGDAYILEEMAGPSLLQDDRSTDRVGAAPGNPDGRHDGDFEAGAATEAPGTVVAEKVQEATIAMGSVLAMRAPGAAQQEAEVVLRIPITVVAAVSTSRKVPPVSLFEIATHAMSELFEAEPMGHEEHARERPRGEDGNPLTRNEVQEDEQRIPEDEEVGRTVGFRPGADEVPGPGWLYSGQDASAISVQPAANASLPDVPELLDHSRKRIAARWFSLRRLFVRDDADESSERAEPVARREQAPIVAVFSIAGGAGKTSLVATMGRALSFLGERVLLSETAAYGLLPFYFGSGTRASGMVRVFTPPPGSTDAPIRLVSYSQAGDEQAGLSDDLVENSERANRVLIDLSADRLKFVAGLARFKPTILVPLMPDMNSVISIDAIEKLFGSMPDAAGRTLEPVYLLNQFDASLPLHLDIREVLKQQLSERLLPFVVRRSPAVGEALAEGMTIVDYDPGSAAAEDYMRLAKWLRSVSAPGATGILNQRWSEQ